MTDYVLYEAADGFGRATFNRPRAHTIGAEMVAALTAALDRAEADPSCRAIILAGTPGIFSAGLDVAELSALGRGAMTEFWNAFNHLIMRLYCSDLMIASAITGHCPAGGCVIAIMTDYRVMAQGRFRIGLNEVAVGIPIPGGISDVYAALLGQRQAEAMATVGALVDPTEALRIGLVDAVVEPDEVIASCEEKVKEWLGCAPAAMVATKKLMRRSIAAQLQRSGSADRAAFLDAWFGDEAQAALAALLARLKG
jgi:enoyl-CoA hydratase/carnithine racemase